jgi:hypothetical protein
VTFSDAHERLDLVARFVRDGLRRRQRVLCLTDEVALCAAVIMQTAARLSASHRMTITCRSLVGRVLDLVGVRVSDRVRVIARHDKSR